MQQNTREGQLTQSQVAVAAYLLSTQRFADVRRQIVAEASRIETDEAQLDRISADTQVTVPNLKSAVQQLRRLEEGTRFDQPTLDQHSETLSALFPQLGNAWDSFVIKARQTKDDQAVIDDVVKQTGQGRLEVKSAIELIANYTPAPATRK